MADSQDTEITLSTSRLLGLFFGLVVVCSLFFGFGYTLGRGSSKQSGSIVAQDAPSTVPPTLNKPVARGSAEPIATKPADCAPGTDCTATTAAAGQTAQTGSQTQDMSFYKSVEQKDAPTQLEKPADAKNGAPEMKSAPLNGGVGSGFMVQVAAVSKKEDAELLKSALQGKQYPVVITGLANDKLFHVQVGPFADMKDAEAIKSRLTNDGYTPILKK
jgi:DedD protein